MEATPWLFVHERYDLSARSPIPRSREIVPSALFPAVSWCVPLSHTNAPLKLEVTTFF